MRISDWSSDVCSSDLPVRLANQPSGRAVIVHHAGWLGVYAHLLFQRAHRHAVADRETALRIRQIFGDEEKADRSEEHTSELQSLMRISYAVFCLKKKKQHQIYTSSTDEIS